MSALKKIAPSNTKKILDELKQINRNMSDTARAANVHRMIPTQTMDSPYFPDRAYSNPLAVIDNPEETEWKKVPTYEEQRNIKLEFEPETKLVVVSNSKKLNII